MVRRSTIALATGVAALGMAAATAHPNAAEHEEINVLPADMDQKAKIELMKHFAQALGVRCTYCHVGEEGQPLSTFDFESDQKETKRTARKMLKLTHMLNQNELLPGEGEASLTDMSKNRVTCYTCHRGWTKPETAIPAPADS